ncbi:cotJB protein [Paenibacillus sp. BIHB 4019]|uniref:CotJB protein n=1 Tax=Paenibacillus sp. BIHB 4019 TaxID=1870819 RepID=A0A1B2DEQ7_9BACL|nr:spore coat protein CotJB [Paenibacillus sp. BIHB 4019]ANY66197.1 cotJB protein [Paenibacillus sp. BIHB 4019]
MSEQPMVCDEAYYAKLLELQQLDFGLLELNLYLDTHPHDHHALQQFNYLAQQRMQCAQQFEMKYGPLMNYGHSFSGYPFQWPNTPWPWQV